jgi:putative oxidoreductase
MTLFKTTNDSAIILIRLMVGVVFLSEGIQKFIFSSQLGAGRFEKIGLPDPEFLAPFVASFEIVCGTLVLTGFLTRLASIPLILIMLTALSTTKLSILMNEGVWDMLHESRTDWSMLLGNLFLLVKGAGNWSVDKKIFND